MKEMFWFMQHWNEGRIKSAAYSLFMQYAWKEEATTIRKHCYGINPQGYSGHWSIPGFQADGIFECIIQFLILQNVINDDTMNE